MKGYDLPWFSRFKWWQKALLALTIGVALVTLLLLPKSAFAAVIFVGVALNVADGFWRVYRDRRG